jgi:hypothetical protein
VILGNPEADAIRVYFLTHNVPPQACPTLTVI